MSTVAQPGRAARAVALVAVALLVLAGCTDRSEPTADPSPSPSAVASPSPPPQTGLRMAVVLPPPEAASDAEIESLRADLERVERAAGRDLAGLQVVQADGEVFTADVLELLAERGNDLVCAIGHGGAEAVLAIAERFPTTRFCVAPASLQPAPSNVLSVDVRVEELAFLAGAAAVFAAPDTPPGFIAGSRAHAVDRRRRAYIEGMKAAGAVATSPLIGFPADDAGTAAGLAGDQLALGVQVVHTVSGAADAGVLAAVAAAGGLATGRAVTLAPGADGPPPTSVLMTSVERIDRALAPVIEQATTEWRGGIVTVGLAEDALAVSGGGSPRWKAVQARVEQLRDAIIAGSVAPLPAE